MGKDVNMKNMQKRAFLGLKRTFMNVSGLPHHILLLKLIYKVFGFIIKIWWGKTWDMHKRAFQALKRTFMHVSGLPHHILIVKLFFKVLLLLSKYGGERPETCINVRFRPWNARLCMSQVFPHHILIIKPYKFSVLQNMVGKDLRHINVRFRPRNARFCMSQVFPHHILIIKLIYKLFGFIIKIWWGKTWDMHKRAFQALKLTFMHVAGLPPPYFDNKTKLKSISFCYQNMVGEDLRHA